MMKLVTSSFSLQKSDVLSVVQTLGREDSAAQVLFVLEIQGDEKKKAETKIKEIFNKSFFQDEIEILLRFEECMKEVNEYLSSFVGEIHGVIVGQQGSEIHISQTGKGEAYLIRKGKLNVIIENIDGEETGDTFTSIASGELMVDDRVILSSLRLLRYATASQIVAVLSEGISEGIDALKDLIEIESQGGAVICFHTRGESIFTQLGDTPQVPRYVRASFLNDIVVQFERGINFIAERTQKPYDFIQNIVFGALGGLFILSLVFFVASASIDNTEKEKYESYKSQILKIEKELQIAETRAQMNEIDSANAILQKIESSVTAMIEESMFVDEGLVILERVQNQRDAANNIIRIRDMSQRILVDIAENAPEESIKDIVVLNDEIYAVTQKNLYKTVLNHIEPAVVITETDEIVRTEAINDRNSILFTLSSGVLKEFIEGEVQSASTADENGFKQAVSESAYNRFVYFLTPQENQIWKYERQREGFTSPSEWISDEEVDLTTAIDLAVDGSIYVLKEGGGVALLHKGEEVPLSVEGGDSDLLVDAIQIYVKPDMRNVYFLNPVRKSVISFEIVNKGLKFLKEYVFETKNMITSFYVDQNEQRMVLADKDKLYEITL